MFSHIIGVCNFSKGNLSTQGIHLSTVCHRQNCLGQVIPTNFSGNDRFEWEDVNSI